MIFCFRTDFKGVERARYLLFSAADERANSSANSKLIRLDFFHTPR